LPHYGSLLDSLIGVSWPARRPIGTGAAGSHISRLRGMTAQFTEYRLYRQGDDPRRLDWKLLARTDRAYLRITDDHATRTTLVLLDASASLAFPADGRTKWLQACHLTVGLAAIARGEGDPAGLTVSSDSGLLRITPRARSGVIGEIAAAVDSITPAGSAGLAPALDGVRPGWRVAIISDFLGDEGALLGRVRQLVVEGVEVFGIHIIAAEEADPSFSPRLASDPEEPGLKRVMHEAVTAEYRENFLAWRGSLAERWRLAGAEYTEVRAEEDPAGAIRRIVRGVAVAGGAR
jgi:uncharacterized protein (DUF58 family)